VCIAGYAHKELIRRICSTPVTRFKVTAGSTAAIVDQPQFLPVLYLAHELEYDADNFDKKAPCYINDITVHTNFEVNFKTVWEFKNPRIDPVES